MTSFIFALLTLAFTFTFETNIATAAQTSNINKNRISVMIDPGHGGEDSGAQLHKIKEKEIALSVALKLKKLLENNPRFSALMTRDHDVFVPLDDRRSIAESKNADVLISIHANSSPESSARGTEFYFENQAASDEESLFLANRENSEKSSLTSRDVSGVSSGSADVNHILNDLTRNEHIQASQQLSQAMLDAFKKNLSVKTRAIRQAPFRVLGTGMPATLIELGFISNAKEAEWLNQAKTQDLAAQAIYDGLLDFKSKLDRTRGQIAQEF
jgi:N-acetylmuramoyl-L-alanine amidase